MVQVLKRTGKLVDFNKQRIISAIQKAYQDARGDTSTPDYAILIADQIYNIAEEMDVPIKVEEIQELVEDYLTEYDKLVAKVYIRYRYKRGVMRSCSDEFIRSISEKLRASNVQNQNANVDEHSFGGRVGEA